MKLVVVFLLSFALLNATSISAVAVADNRLQLDLLKSKFLASYHQDAQRVQSETHNMVKNAQAVAENGIPEASLLQLNALQSRLESLHSLNQNEADLLTKGGVALPKNFPASPPHPQSAPASPAGGSSLVESAASVASASQKTSMTTAATAASTRTVSKDVSASHSEHNAHVDAKTLAWISNPNLHVFATLVEDPQSELANDLTVVPMDGSHYDVHESIQSHVGAKPALSEEEATSLLETYNKQARAGQQEHEMAVIQMVRRGMNGNGLQPMESSSLSSYNRLGVRRTSRNAPRMFHPSVLRSTVFPSRQYIFKSNEEDEDSDDPSPSMM